MSPTIPFTTVRDRAINKDDLQVLATERVLPPGLQQRRDSQGKYQSHRELPDTSANDNNGDDSSDSDGN